MLSPTILASIPLVTFTFQNIVDIRSEIEAEPSSMSRCNLSARLVGCFVLPAAMKTLPGSNLLVVVACASCLIETKSDCPANLVQILHFVDETTNLIHSACRLPGRGPGECAGRERRRLEGRVPQRPERNLAAGSRSHSCRSRALGRRDPRRRRARLALDRPSPQAAGSRRAPRGGSSRRHLCRHVQNIGQRVSTPISAYHMMIYPSLGERAALCNAEACEPSYL